MLRFATNRRFLVAALLAGLALSPVGVSIRQLNFDDWFGGLHADGNSVGTYSFASAARSDDGRPLPDTSITSSSIDGSTAEFQFTTSDSTSRFECKVDGGAWKRCASPAAYADLSGGSHTFAVRAVTALGADTTAATSVLVVPVGSACQASDGKISGRGSMLQADAQQALIAGYRHDVCGPVEAQYPGDPAGANMIAYNYPAAVAGRGVGSDQGLLATSCRSDAFGSSDAPYTQATLDRLNGAAGALGSCALAFDPPFTTGGPIPGAADSSRAVMSFPIAGAAVAIGARLEPTAGCPTPPSALKFSATTLSRLLGGGYTNWSDPDLVADNPSLSGCDKPVIRVKRTDESESTRTIKNFLNRADGARPQCDGLHGWEFYAGHTEVENWPEGPTCSAIVAAADAGSLVHLVGSTDGAIGYADAPDWNESPAILTEVQTAADPSLYAAPLAGRGANCDFSDAALPGATDGDAVGLNRNGENWATDASVVRSDVTFAGSRYPICGLTWDFVYTGLSDGGVANAIAGLTANQRRTLLSYFTYVLSPAGQSRLAAAGYAPLPATMSSSLRQGFQDGVNGIDTVPGEPTPPLPEPSPQPQPQPPAHTPDVAGFRVGMVMRTWEQNDTAAWNALKPKSGAPVRFEIAAANPAAGDKWVDFYAGLGATPQPMANFFGGVPSNAQIDALAAWARSKASKIKLIELGNEDSYTYKYGDGPQDGSYQTRARAYGAAVKRLGQGLAGSGVGVLAQAEDANTGSAAWVDQMYAAAPDLHKWVAGWVLHPYGLEYMPRLNRMVAQVADYGGDLKVYCTELGLATDNGRTLTDNYGWSKSMTYQQAGDTLRRLVGELKASGKVAQILLYQSTDQQASGSTSDREAFFGLLQKDGTPKGALTQAAIDLLS